MRKLFFLFFLFVFAFTSSVCAGDGVIGGLIVVDQDTDTITASGTMTSGDTDAITVTAGSGNDYTFTGRKDNPVWNADSVFGTSYGNASPTSLQVYIYNATSTTLVPYTLTGGTNLTITATSESELTFDASTVAAPTDGTIFFNSVFPSDTNPGTTDTTRKTVYLSPAGTTSAKFNNDMIPRDWDEASNLTLELIFGTPDAAEAADVVVQLKYQSFSTGDAFFGSGSWFTIGTFTISVANNATIQKYNNASFILNVASMTLKDIVQFRIDRIGDNAGDTHGDNFHIVGLDGAYTK